MTTIDRTELTADYPQEFSSYLSIDVPFLDEVSSESSAREQGFCKTAASISTEDLTGKRRKPPTVSRTISRSRSMDRYRTDRRSRSQSGRRVRTRRSSSLRPVDPSLAPPLDFMVIQYSRQSICPSQCSSRPRSNVSRQPSQRDRKKERKRRRIVWIIMVSFLLLALASILVVVVTLTHSSTVKVHNVTSKYYTFAVPPHHPLIRQENERMIHESFNAGHLNNTQPVAAQRTSPDVR